jgi:MFS family permease
MAVVKAQDLSESQKSLMFWASFLALTSAGIGFVFRSMVPSIWANHFEVTDAEVGALFGAGLWPIAITMILFSLIVDKIGYKISMFLACLLQGLSVFLTIYSNSYDSLWYACLCAGFGHGIVEACINPLCASIYRDEKSKWLNILHASWPAGLVIGGTVYLTLFQGNDAWVDTKSVFWWMLIPVVIYSIMFAMCKAFPEDERVEHEVGTMDMLREFGGLGAFLAVTFLAYEMATQMGLFSASSRLGSCVVIGALGGLAFGFAVKSLGKPMFFALCVIMIPLATAEIATDGWIQNLMKPTLGDHAGWALVFSASIMMVLRFFAGIPLKFMSPPALLCMSSAFSIVGLFALSEANGIMIFFAFIFYAVGQTFYWPTVLGLVAEQFPKGGAMTLNTVSAMGLLTVGIFGFPFFGAVQDSINAQVIEREQPALVSTIKSEKRVFGEENKAIFNVNVLFGISYHSIQTQGVLEQKELSNEAKTSLQKKLNDSVGRGTLKVAALLPSIMALAFLMMMMYFKMNGGYRPVHLEQT